MRIPDWLSQDPIARSFWHRYYPAFLREGLITPTNEHLFPVLAQTYADYRKTIGSEDPVILRHQKALRNDYIRLSGEFTVTPKSAAQTRKTSEVHAHYEELDKLLS